MPIPQHILELENRGLGRDGEPTHAAAYRMLKQLWLEGNRDREVMLHLLFLTWYGMEEPTHITGFPYDVDEKGVSHTDTVDAQTRGELQATFNQVYAFIEPTIDSDAEMLYVVGLMASLFPWWLGLERDWRMLSEKYRRLYRKLAPDGFDPSVFEGRGLYGEYFAYQTKGKDGY